jgi:hypothetical protein
MGLLVMAASLDGKRATAAEPDYREALRAIDRQLAKLGREFPQMAAYAKTRELELDQLVIGYAFHTHPPTRHVGWTGAVPNPDDDGIWFHIDLHDPDSQAQIHTQPVTFTKVPLGKKIAFLLSLEGRKTKPVGGRIWEIIENVARTSTLAADRKPSPARSTLRLGGLIVAIEASPLPASTKNWVVTLEVEEVRQGRFDGGSFAFRVHSPTKSRLTVGRHIEVVAQPTPDGYEVDDLQWLRSP